MNSNQNNSIVEVPHTPSFVSNKASLPAEAPINAKDDASSVNEIQKSYSISLPPVESQDDSSMMSSNPMLSAKTSNGSKPSEMTSSSSTSSSSSSTNPLQEPYPETFTPTVEMATVTSSSFKLEADFQEQGNDETSRSAESPLLHEQDKLTKMDESYPDLPKEAQLETTVVLEPSFNSNPTETLMPTIEMPPTMEQEREEVEEEKMELSSKDTMESRTPTRRTSLKKGRVAKVREDFIREGDISAGSIVFAQVKGFPMWPAMVLEPTDIPEKFLPKKLSMNVVSVMFFESFEYAFVSEKDVIPFEPNLDMVLSMNKTKRLQIAVNEAQTQPMLIHVKNKAIWDGLKLSGTANELVDEEDVHTASSSELPTATPKRGRRSHAASTLSMSSATSSSTSSSSMSKDITSKKAASKRLSPTNTPNRKRSRVTSPTLDEVTPTSKRVKRSYSSSKTSGEETSASSSQRSSKHHSNSGAVYTKPASTSTLASRAEVSKRTSESIHNSLMRIRHLLQRTFIKDKSSEMRPRASAETVHTLEWPLITTALDELDHYLKHSDFDNKLFQSTKLPKVLILISSTKYDAVVEEKMREHHILHRVNELLDTIKSFIPASSTESASRTHHTETTMISSA